MTRWKASSIHLALSAVIASAVFALFVLVWYPPPLFGATGGTRLLRTILLVDVVLGPLLTLIVFKPGKWGLKFDLATIATLQVCALAFGLYVSFQARPAWIAVSPYRATLVRAEEVHHDGGVAAYARAPLWGARFVGVRDPDPEEKQRLFDDLLAGIPDTDYRTAYYVPLAERTPDIAARTDSLEERMSASPTARAYYADWMRRRGIASTEGLHVLPLITPVEEIELIVDVRDASIAGMLWPPSTE